MSFMFVIKLEMQLIDYIVSFLAVKRGFKLIFEHKECGHSEGAAYIIRLIEPENLLQTRVRF